MRYSLVDMYSLGKKKVLQSVIEAFTLRNQEKRSGEKRKTVSALMRLVWGENVTGSSKASLSHASPFHRWRALPLSFMLIVNDLKL